VRSVINAFAMASAAARFCLTSDSVFCKFRTSGNVYSQRAGFMTSANFDNFSTANNRLPFSLHFVPRSVLSP
jgi:hypothetical protein